MTILDDLDRIEPLLAGANEPKRLWFVQWADEFQAAVADADDERCSDLHDQLICFERLELDPREGPLLSIEELITELGLDPAELELDS